MAGSGRDQAVGVTQSVFIHTRRLRLPVNEGPGSDEIGAECCLPNGVSGQLALADTAMPTPELPPVDVDLQDLYEQVLAGFTDDPPPELPTPVSHKANPSDLDSLYSSYAEDSADPSSKLSRNTSYTIASQRTQTSPFISLLCFR